MAQIYCTEDDIISIIGEAAVVACIDDDQDGTRSVDDDAKVDACIERAAVEMNQCIASQYKLSDVAANDWCKWCNAYLACYYLYKRRANPGPISIGEDIAYYRQLLGEIRYGRQQIPEQNPSHEHTPTVSNFNPELRKTFNKIRVVPEESTGSAPVDGIQRHTSDIPGPY